MGPINPLTQPLVIRAENFENTHDAELFKHLAAQDKLRERTTKPWQDHPARHMSKQERRTR